MKRESAPHLDEDLLIRAVVDEADLPADAAGHLAGCDACRQRAESLDRDLARLGEVARRQVPFYGKRIRLPDEASSRSGFRLRFGGLAAGALAAAAALLLVFWGAPYFRPSSPVPPALLSEAAWQDDRFMAQVDLLVENSLPPVYLEIAGEGRPELDEEFIQFLIPPLQGSISMGRRGAA